MYLKGLGHDLYREVEPGATEAEPDMSAEIYVFKRLYIELGTPLLLGAKLRLKVKLHLRV